MAHTDLCTDIQSAIAAFQLEGTPVSWERYGNGHINDTFLLVCETDSLQKRYILQRINHTIFKNPVELMENISGVTTYLNRIIAKYGGDPLRETLNLVTTRTGSPLFYDPLGSYWRCYLFVEHTVCYEQVTKPEDFYESGKAFGNFQKLLSEYPAARLHDTIPNFHNTPLRYQALLTAAAEDRCQRAALVRPELEFIMAREKELSAAIEMQKAGILPLRVTHNDTKLNNILFDRTTGAALCVIDLDTIMPGLSMNDFGDAIRFGANTALEDETDLTKVSLSLPLFECYTKGFLEGCDGRLTKEEIQMLPMGAKLMTMECGIRFLTDYLQGDTYFRIHRPEHNLDRTRTQLKLTADMEDQWEAMAAVIQIYENEVG